MYERALTELASKILGEVEGIIGYAPGSLPFHMRPFLCQREEDIACLSFNHFARPNLARYLLTLEMRKKRVAIVVKGCDARTVIVLLKEGQVKRENLYLIGAPCHGMVSVSKLEERFGVLSPPDFVWEADTFTWRGERFAIRDFLEDSCERCAYPNPPWYDALLGEELPKPPVLPGGRDYLGRIKALPLEKRWEFFAQEMEKCIRCYACRNSCPLCYCTECFVDQTRPSWLSQAATRNENLFFHLGRSLHMAGRCTECGACERACPLGIPIGLLPLYVEELIREHFAFEAGMNLDTPAPLLTYRENDPNEFIR